MKSQHMVKLTERLACDLCDFTTHYSESMEKHKLLKHETEKHKFNCEKCAKTFGWESHLKRQAMAHVQLTTFF